MKVSAALLAHLPGLAPDASTAAVEAAVLPLLRLSAGVLSLTRAAGADEALGAVKAAVLDAARVPALEASLSAQTAAAEASERVSLLEGAVSASPPKLLPADAWRWSEDGKTRSIASDYGPPSTDANGQPMGLSIAQLRGFLERKGPAALGTGTSPKPKPPSAEEEAALGAVAGLTAAQLQFARSQGIDPARFAALFPNPPAS